MKEKIYGILPKMKFIISLETPKDGAVLYRDVEIEGTWDEVEEIRAKAHNKIDEILDTYSLQEGE